MYNIMLVSGISHSWHLHILWKAHHNKSSNHLSPYKVITLLLMIFLLLYILSLWFVYNKTGGLNLLVPSPILSTLSPLPSLPSDHDQFSVSEAVFILFVLFYRLHIWVKVMWCLSLFLWLTYHSSLKVHPCCCKCQDFILFMAE